MPEVSIFCLSISAVQSVKNSQGWFHSQRELFARNMDTRCPRLSNPSTDAIGAFFHPSPSRSQRNDSLTTRYLSFRHLQSLHFNKNIARIPITQLYTQIRSLRFYCVVTTHSLAAVLGESDIHSIAPRAFLAPPQNI